MMIGNDVAPPLDHAIEMARWNLLAHDANLGHILDQFDAVTLCLASAAHDDNVRKAQLRLGHRPVKHQAIAAVVVKMIGRPGSAVLPSRQAEEATNLLLGHPDDEGSQQAQADQKANHQATSRCFQPVRPSSRSRASSYRSVIDW